MAATPSSSSPDLTVLEAGRPLAFTPELGRVLLRIMRKAAERRGINLDADDSAEVARLASPPS